MKHVPSLPVHAQEQPSEAWGLVTSGYLWVVVHLRPPFYRISRAYPLPLDNRPIGKDQRECAEMLLGIVHGILRERMGFFQAANASLSSKHARSSRHEQ